MCRSNGGVLNGDVDVPEARKPEDAGTMQLLMLIKG
jgi:hypothetical protein